MQHVHAYTVVLVVVVYAWNPDLTLSRETLGFPTANGPETNKFQREKTS